METPRTSTTLRVHLKTPNTLSAQKRGPRPVAVIFPKGK